MQNKENQLAYSAPSTKPRDIGASNPLLSLAENNWDPTWDQSLQNLVVECSFDFNQISSKMNQAYQTSAFSTEALQKRWGELHKMRKQKKGAPAGGPGVEPAAKVAENVDKDKQNVDRLMRLSAPPMQDPKKGMTLQELEEILPKTRTQKDFLDPSTMEFDKATDVLITGEKIVPSGFNILKDRIRPTVDEQKRREEEFLKNLDKMAMDFGEGDNENPFVFKPVFGGESDFQIEKFTFDTEEAKKRLEEQVDMSQVKGIEREAPVPTLFAKAPEQETWRDLQQKELEVKVAAANPEAKEAEKKEEEEEEFDKFEKNEDFIKMFAKPIDIGDAVKALEKLEENVTHQKRVFFKDESESEEEQEIKPEVPEKRDVFAALEGAPEKAYSQFQNLWSEPQLKNVEPVKPQEVPQNKPLQGILKKETPLATTATPTPEYRLEEVKPAAPVVQKDKEAESKKLKEAEEARRNRLFENLKAREVQDFEGSDVDEEEFVDQRKRIHKKDEARPAQERNVEEGEKPAEEAVVEDKETKAKREEEERLKAEQEAKEKEEEEERISEERLKKLIELSFALKKKEEKPVAQPIEEKEEEPVEEEEDEEEKRKREKRQRKLDEHGKKLASLLKEVNQRNVDFEKQKEEEEKKLKEEEEFRVKQQQEEKKKEEIDNLKGAWTNSYVTSLFDDKVSYLKPINSLPSELSNHFSGGLSISERERLLGRYQMLCLPILGHTNEYIAALLEYFLKFSSFNVTKVDGSRIDNESVFLFKTIAVGMFSRFEGQGKVPLQKTVEDGGLVDYLYILFDTFEGRGNRILEDVVRGLQLDYVFGEAGAKRIQKELNQVDNSLVLRDIIIFHYKNLEIIDEVFNTKAAMTGICLNQTEDPKNNEYESTVVLFPFEQKEKAVVGAKDRDQWKSNLSAFLRKISKENLHAVGLKSIYMSKDDLENFKYKVGTLPISEPQPLIAVVVGGYKAVEKVKNIIGSTDFAIAKKLEPKSINAKYGAAKTDVAHIVCCPTNSHTAKRWLSFLFGGRVSHKDFIVSDLQPVSKFKKEPKLYQLITKPVKRVMVMVSSKMGNRGLPRLLKELVNKGFFINDVRMFTRNLMKQQLEHVDKVANEKFAALGNKLDLHCFKFFCDTTQNPCNFLISLQGSNPEFLKENLTGFLFPKDASDPKHLLAIIEDEDDLNLLDSIFFHNKVKYSSPELSHGKNMKHYLLLRPLENLNDVQQGCEDLQVFMSNDLELIGCEVMHPHRLHPVRNILEAGLIQSIRVSSYTKKRKEFQNFLSKAADYLENGFLLAAVLRLQDPLKTSEELAKLPNLANSNFYIPETMIFNYGKQESATPVTRDLFEQVLLEFNMDDVLQLTETLGMALGDDRTIAHSFIYDLPPKIDGIVQSEVVSTVLTIARSTVALSSLSFVTKFFENHGFVIQKISLLSVPEELIEGIQYNYACYNPQDVEKWPILKEKLATEPFWTFTLSKYNAIFECKTLVYELLKKVHLIAKASYGKQVSEKDLPYLYGVYFSRSYEDSIRDLSTFDKIYNNRRNLLSANKVDLASKLEPVDPNSVTTEPAFILFRNKAGADKQELHDFLDMFHNLKIKILNFRAVEAVKEDDREALVEVFKAKHNEDALKLFLASNMANYYVMSIEYKLGSTLNELVGSFRMKSPEEVVEFSKGFLLKKYGSEFLYTSNFQEVEKLTVRFFGVIDSEHFRII